MRGAGVTSPASSRTAVQAVTVDGRKHPLTSPRHQSSKVLKPPRPSHLLQLVEVERVLVASLPLKPDEEQVHL